MNIFIKKKNRNLGIFKFFNRKRKFFFKNKKKTQFFSKKIKNVFYSDLAILKRFMNSSAKIIPSKISNVNLYYQNKLKRFIKISKFLGLNYYTFNHKI